MMLEPGSPLVPLPLFDISHIQQKYFIRNGIIESTILTDEILIY